MHTKNLIAIACLAAAPVPFAQAVQKPNILLILADDAGYNDFGFQNGDPLCQAATPNIDSIARDGVRFTESYVSANVCAPSRAGLITGRYQERNGFRDNPDENQPEEEDWRAYGLDTSVKTIGDYLKSLGYRTGIVGKWHLGFSETFAPYNRGFDEFTGLRMGSRSYFPIKKIPVEISPDTYRQIEKNGVFLPEANIKHVTETFGDAALEFLEKTKDSDKPFFLYLSFTAPHQPLQPDAESLTKAKELFPQAAEDRQKYMGLVIGLDRQVGRVLEQLKRLGLEKDTLVVFLSDNGGSDKNGSNNDPLRGHKWTPFEGGYRVPMILKWPGVAKPGSTIKEPVISLDLAPTFITAAGGSLPPDLDGKALQPVLDGGSLDPRTFCWWDCNAEGLTSTTLIYPWKLIQREEYVRGKRTFKTKGGTDPWLFNLETDQAETTNLAGQYPEKVKELKTVFDAWVVNMPPPRW